MTKKPHYQVTAGLIRQQDRLLITQRPTGKHMAGFWEFPGGKQEAHETLPQCLMRELKEELGLDIAVNDLFMTVEHAYETKSITLHCYICDLLQGTPTGLEGQETRWATIAELQTLTFTPPDQKIIAALIGLDRDAS